MVKFTTCVSALLVILAENGGKNNLIFEKVYKLLTESSCSLFNSEIVVYKQVNFAALDMHKLHIKARDDYYALVTNKEWKSNKMNKKNNRGCTERSHKRSDIAALLAKKVYLSTLNSCFIV